MQVQLNNAVVRSEDKEPLRADDGNQLDNRDGSKSGSVRFALIYSFMYTHLKK